MISYYILRHLKEAVETIYDQDVSYNPLPKPLFCNSTLCSAKAVPKCLNMERPTFGSSGGISYIGQQIVKYDESESVRLIPKLERRMYPLSYCKHLDSAGWIETREVVFKIPKMAVGLIFVCKCCGKSSANTVFGGMEVHFDKHVFSKDKWRTFPENKCVQVVDDAKYAGKGPFMMKLKSSKVMRISHVVVF